MIPLLNTYSDFLGSIRSFLQRALRPTVSTVTEKNLTSFRRIDEIVFVAQMAHEHAVFKHRFETIAKRYGDRFSFAVMTSQHETTVVCYNIKGVEMVLPDLTTVDALQNFVKQCSAPLIPELTRRNEMEYSSVSYLVAQSVPAVETNLIVLQKGKSFVHYFVSSAGQRDDYVTEMLPLAKKYEEYLLFTTIDVNEYPEMLPVYGQRPGTSKVLSVYHPSNGQIFPHRKMEKADAAVVEQFLVDIIEGKVKSWSGDSSSEVDMGHDEL